MQVFPPACLLTSFWRWLFSTTVFSLIFFILITQAVFSFIQCLCSKYIELTLRRKLCIYFCRWFFVSRFLERCRRYLLLDSLSINTKMFIYLQRGWEMSHFVIHFCLYIHLELCNCTSRKCTDTIFSHLVFFSVFTSHSLLFTLSLVSGSYQSWWWTRFRIKILKLQVFIWITWLNKKEKNPSCCWCRAYFQWVWFLIYISKYMF